MAILGCHCGARLSNMCDGDELAYYFVSDDILREHWEDMGFFAIQSDRLMIEMWKCDVCDRMMVFGKASSHVKKFMKQVEAEAVPEEELAKPYLEGLCYNNLLFNDVDEYFTHRDGPDYVFYERMEGEEDKPLLTSKIMFEEVFSLENGRFQHWWYARMYDEYLVLYSPHREEWSKPVRAWKCYECRAFDENGKPVD